MRIESEKNIRKFHEEISEEFPDLTFQQLKEICHGPWEFLKREMGNKRLPEVRIKYFGVFRVNRGTAVQKLKSNKVRFEKGLMEEPRYNSLKEMLENFLEDDK